MSGTGLGGRARHREPLVANWLAQGAGAPAETVAAVAMTRAIVGALAPCAKAGDQS